jgi:CTP-dependent riboflavin kinase
MWLVDKMTSFSEEGIGKVLGGKPINYPEVKKELGISQDTYTRWIEKLAAYPYIEVTRTPYGIVFRVLKAYKRFGKRIRNTAESTSAQVRNHSQKSPRLCGRWL